MKLQLGLVLLFVTGCGAGSGGSSSSLVSGVNAQPQPRNIPNGDDGSGAGDVGGDDVSQDFVFTPSTDLFTINWQQFGDFSLPPSWKLVYMGPHMYDLSLPCLSHGFTQVIPQSTPNAALANVLPSQRAIIWGMPGGPNDQYVGAQPWANAWLPWGNDISAYNNYWSNVWLKPMANLYPDSAGKEVPDCAILCSDGEKFFPSDEEILASKNNSYVPGRIQQLPDADYIDSYKKAMAQLYNTSHEYVKSKGFAGLQTTYGEPPIRRQTWQIAYKTWEEWTTNPNQDLSNYLLGDYNSSAANWDQQHGPFYDNCGPICPSAYYFNDYPDQKSDNPAAWTNAGHYLAYLLFQVEVNRFYTDKDMIEWIYLRYHPSSQTPGKFIRNHMAEATAIFPFFAGAKGLWLYEYFPGTYGAGDPNLNYATYEYFLNGLYRLSKHKEMFVGNYTTYMPTNPRDLLVNNQPIWRGIINQAQTKMLVAAQNPYAEDEESTTFDISYNEVSLGTVVVKGRETALVEFPLTPPTAICVGDLNLDGVVDSVDLSLLLADFGLTGRALASDLNGDQVVNYMDQVLLISNWGSCGD